ncbi:MAG: citrate/2-methylcitrate synthase [Candidatus Woesearchaeota archaeon]|jgi:citrate synthase
MVEEIRDGLSTVIALDTGICQIDGGKSTIRGYSLDNLVMSSTFEEVVWLLIHGDLPSSSDYQTFLAELKEIRESIPAKLKKQIEMLEGNEHPLSVLASCFSLMSADYEMEIPPSEITLKKDTVRSVVSYHTLLTAYLRKRRQRTLWISDSGDSLVRNFCEGVLENRDPLITGYLEKVLIGSSENELTASTFNARVAVSARTDVYAALASGILTWKGYRHGTASGYAMKDLKELAESGQDPQQFYRDKRARKSPFFGFGHRLHKTELDQRVSITKLGTEIVCQRYSGRLFEYAERAERYMKEHEGRLPNPDLYLACFFDAIGLKEDEVSAVVFMGRVAGIAAHIIEESHPTRRIMRPRALYNGPTTKKYIQLTQR